MDYDSFVLDYKLYFITALELNYKIYITEYIIRYNNI